MVGGFNQSNLGNILKVEFPFISYPAYKYLVNQKKYTKKYAFNCFWWNKLNNGFGLKELRMRVPIWTFL